MNTPRSDKAWEAWRKSGNAQHIRSESCRLETELAAVTKELADAQADVAAEIAQGEIYKAERDSAKSTLASADREIERLNLMVQMMDESKEMDEIKAQRDALIEGEKILWKQLAGRDESYAALSAERDELAQEKAELISQGLSLAVDRNACAAERDALKKDYDAVKSAWRKACEERDKLKADFQKSDERWIAREAELLTENLALKHALIELESASEVYAADQSRATDSRCGIVQPITVEDGNRLLSALKIANELTK